ncbi:MAG TPA: hypothetical protein PKE54_22515 [Candidatus Obscuribacter sp.]|nr:hypothetical protein [Candidatus Obscuribacter sp.]HMW92820.1 hypothetical protein [Candidatus Obscuribacter sp.]
MNKLALIPITIFPANGSLISAHSALVSALEETKTARGLLHAVESDMRTEQDTEAAADEGSSSRRRQPNRLNILYYAAKLRLTMALQDLVLKRAELVKSIVHLRYAVDESTKSNVEAQKDAARINVIFAENLSLSAYQYIAAVEKSLSYGLNLSELYVEGKPVNLSAIVGEEYSRLIREWLVQSSGHGSAFRFDEGDGSAVPVRDYYLTVDEATHDAISWEVSADTIGGRAQLYNVSTGDVKAPGQRPQCFD